MSEGLKVTQSPGNQPFKRQRIELVSAGRIEPTETPLEFQANRILADPAIKSALVDESNTKDAMTRPQIIEFNLLSFVKTIAYLGGVFLRLFLSWGRLIG